MGEIEIQVPDLGLNLITYAKGNAIAKVIQGQVFKLTYFHGSESVLRVRSLTMLPNRLARRQRLLHWFESIGTFISQRH